MELGRRGRVWSYTDARYQPPAPYVAADPYVPFTLAAVELEAEKMVVHGPSGRRGLGRRPVGGRRGGTRDRLLYEDDDHEYLVWKWRPVGTW